MKTKNTNEEAAAPQPKAKVKIKNLKLTKETLKDLSFQNADAVKGGARAPAPSHTTCQGGTDGEAKI